MRKKQVLISKIDSLLDLSLVLKGTDITLETVHHIIQNQLEVGNKPTKI